MSDFPIHHGIRLASGGFIENLHVEVVSSDPTPVANGRIWYNTTEKAFRIGTLNPDGSGSVVIRSFATVEAMEALVDAEETARIAADAAIQTELDATQTGAGLGTDGAYTAPVGSNYLGSAVSLKDADSKLDTQVKTVADDLADEVTDRTDADAAIQTELDATQVGAGLGTDGAYTAPVVSNYLSAATSLKDADSKLDTQVKSVADGLAQEIVDRAAADSDLQDELDATQTGAGLGSSGAYTAPAVSNYLAAATSLKDADSKLDTQIKTVADGLSTEISDRAAADSDLQDELDATQTGAGLGSDGAYTAPAVSNYLSTATSLKNADSLLDSQIKTVADALAQEIIDRGDADDALDVRLDTVEGSYIKKDGSVAFTGNVDAGTHKVVNVSAPTSANDATNKDYVDAEIAILDSKITALGNAFNYVGTIAGGADAGSATDMALQAENDVGDFYKVSTAGYFKHSTVTAAFYANVNDAIVFNIAGGIDKIDNTDSTVAGTANYIAVTGSADTGFVVDIDTDFKDRMTTAEGDIVQEISDRQDADAAIQTELDATQVGAGLGTDGAYTAPVGSNYLGAATSLKNADSLLDSQVKTVADDLAQEVIDRAAADSDIQDELDATQTGAGLGATGAYTAPAVSNYLAAATSLKDADSKLDTQIKTVADGLSTEISDRAAADQDLQDELDATQTGAGLGSSGAYTAPAVSNYLGSAVSLKDADSKLDTQIKSVQDELDTTQAGAGLGTDGAYTANASSNYLTAATSLKDADNKLDAQIKILSDAKDALQSEVDATQTGAGLGTDGSYTAPVGSNYLGSAVSLKDADSKLDTQVKTVADSVATFKTDFNALRATFQSATAAVEHTFAHNLNSAFVDFTVMVEREDGSWRNDVVGVQHYDNNTLKVFLSVSRKVRISATSMASIS